jgi:hypothetical protein
MSGSTPNYALPYPSLTDSPNGAAQIQALAAAADTALATAVAALAAQIAAINQPSYGIKATAAGLGNNTSMTPDASLAVSLNAGAGTYKINGYIKYDAGSAALFKHSFIVPTNAKVRYACTHQNTAGAQFTFPCNGADVVQSYGNNAGNVLAILIDGTAVMEGTTGTLQLQFGNINSGALGYTIYDGSYLEAVRIA